MGFEFGDSGGLAIFAPINLGIRIYLDLGWVSSKMKYKEKGVAKPTYSCTQLDDSCKGGCYENIQNRVYHKIGVFDYCSCNNFGLASVALDCQPSRLTPNPPPAVFL